MTVTAVPTSVAPPEQVLELKYSYWTVPPAVAVSPLSVAASCTDPPAPMEPVDKAVAMVGLVLVTMRLKDPELVE